MFFNLHLSGSPVVASSIRYANGLVGRQLASIVLESEVPVLIGVVRVKSNMNSVFDLACSPSVRVSYSRWRALKRGMLGHEKHRRTGRGGWGSCSPPKFWATQIFWAAREIWAKPVFKEASVFFFSKRYIFPILT